tara:strand:- start:364 stop:630 length:267 start_codon:yes stop_codon:yes gene_type:complete
MVKYFVFYIMALSMLLACENRPMHVVKYRISVEYFNGEKDTVLYSYPAYPNIFYNKDGCLKQTFVTGSVNTLKCGVRDFKILQIDTIK